MRSMNLSTLSIPTPIASALALTVTCLAGVDTPVLAQSKPGGSPCDIQTTERVVALGATQGALDGFGAILRAAQIIDSRNRWSGRRAVLVQTGDVLDRGPDSRK